eukprot:GFUD01088840.1.p2 GENE.GFUD01088840.1~~GFUD01088840.1.p2  ORF type:complete len:187 (-),score=51.95 GFUD01088840.1:67-627(-)
MKVLLILCLALAGTWAAPDPRFTCAECVDEMHKFGFLVRMAEKDIQAYLEENYCPTVDDVEECMNTLARIYPNMLEAVVRHYIVDGAIHVCQTMGVCDARRYTCEECVVGLEWVEAYLEDPIMIAEMTVFLEQNACIDEWENCKEVVKEHFPPMHRMAMEKFMIPQEICNQEPVCTGVTNHPTKPF